LLTRFAPLLPRTIEARKRSHDLLGLEQFHPGRKPLFMCPGHVFRHRSSVHLEFHRRREID